ncbi:MAG: SIS domain-containing protein [Kiritimatiellae bacterium]|nr:SIS domain-containing protein [Kiritimatiellia bacterium]
MNWNQISQEYVGVAQHIFSELKDPVHQLANELAGRLQQGNKVLVCGNGGSAGDAQHMVGELVNRFLKERKPYAGIALTTDTSVLTAIGNDYNYDCVFEKQVEALGKKEDALIGISTSGNAENVCRAITAAKKMGILTIGFTGGTGGRVGTFVDMNICVSTTQSTPRIQEGHGLIIHLLCERIEEIIG